MNKREKSIPGATDLMAFLVRQKPKPHEEMKVGKKRMTEKQRQDSLSELIKSDDPENTDETADLPRQRDEPGS